MTGDLSADAGGGRPGGGRAGTGGGGADARDAAGRVDRAAGIAVPVDGGLRPFLEALGLPDVSQAPRGEPLTLSDGLRLLLVDAWDVPVLVERGVVDGGVAAHHIVSEVPADVVRLLDLGVAPSRLALLTTSHTDRLPVTRRPRVATTHPRTTRRYFAGRGMQVEVMALRAAADVAVALGAADAAVVPLDGEGEQPPNGLVVRAEVSAGNARLLVGRSSRVVRATQVDAVLECVRTALGRLREEGGADAAP